MLRSELPARLAERFPQLQRTDTEAAVDVILLAIRDALAAGSRVEIRGFGSFSVRHGAPRNGRNPKTGEAVAVPAKSRPHFKPGREMRARVENGQ